MAELEARERIPQLLPSEGGFIRLSQVRRRTDLARGVFGEEILFDGLGKDVLHVGLDLQHCVLATCSAQFVEVDL